MKLLTCQEGEEGKKERKKEPVEWED